MVQAVIEEQYPVGFREKEAGQLGSHLRHRHSVNIIGVKRIGISNFLKFFLHHKKIIPTYIADNRQHLFVPIDLNDLVELEPYAFWTLTLKRVVDSIESSEISPELKKKISSLFLNSIQSQDLFLLIDNLRQALVLIVGQSILPTLFFIRFDRIAPIFTPSFFDNLKGLRDAARHEVSYVFTSFRSLSSLYPEAKASLASFVQSIYLPPASEKDMRAIYQDYKKRYNLKLRSVVEDALFKLVSGNVQYLQLALIIINEKKNHELSSEAGLASLLIGDERITLQSEEIWESLEKEEKRCLVKIIKHEDLTPQEEDKNSYLFDTGLVVKKQNKNHIFSHLLEAYLVSREEGDKKNGQSAAIHLTKKEHLLFTHLQEHKESICEREMIIEAVWPEYKDLGVSDWAIDRLVARVRVKLKQQNSPYEIITVRTRGYKLSEIKE